MFKIEKRLVKTYEAAMNIVTKAIIERKSASTPLNRCSSRSHLLIGLTLYKGYSRQRIASLCLADLVGAERPLPGDKSLQTAFINSTLT